SPHPARAWLPSTTAFPADTRWKAAEGPSLDPTSYDPQGDAEDRTVSAGQSRARRLFEGWSANLLQVVLGITQQVALIPIFLHYWSSEVLAGWLVIYAAGNLAGVAEMGLPARAINRFLSFRSCADCNGRTAAFFSGMLRIYLGLSAVLVVLLLG